jgi:hypothetical protein
MGGSEGEEIMSRPKGSKNKKTLAKLNDEPVIKRGRGRPRKIKEVISELRPEPVNISSGNIKDLKRQIRELKKLKLQMKSGSIDRIKTHRHIKELKKQLSGIKESKENLVVVDHPLPYIPKPKAEPIIALENCSDTNGCSYYGYCKAINKNGLINRTCYNPSYILHKLDKKCTQIILSEE